MQSKVRNLIKVKVGDQGCRVYVSNFSDPLMESAMYLETSCKIQSSGLVV